jgi:hypothetical protein
VRLQPIIEVDQDQVLSHPEHQVSILTLNVAAVVVDGHLSQVSAVSTLCSSTWTTLKAWSNGGMAFDVKQHNGTLFDEIQSSSFPQATA